MKSVGRLVLCLLLCVGVGIIGSVVTGPEIPVWYAGLSKPPWTPPSVAFPVAWSILYFLMALSLWRLWDRAPVSPTRTTAIRLFVVQLALNAAWSPVFFGWHGIRAALVIIIVLLIAIAATLIAAFRADRPAGWLLVPYLAWVAFATTLNAGIVALN
jgi:tryptophan-rich sensory protein